MMNMMIRVTQVVRAVTMTWTNNNINDISSIMGDSFAKMGRPSDMDEGRIISKEVFEEANN